MNASRRPPERSCAKKYPRRGSWREGILEGPAEKVPSEGILPHKYSVEQIKRPTCRKYGEVEL